MDSSLAKKISADSSERLWFIARANVLKGPFTTSQLREKVQKRELNYLDFCWRQGFNEWRPMGSVEDFDRRTKFRKLPQYPQVEVPASSNGGIYLVDSAPLEGEESVGKTFLRRVPSRSKFLDSKGKPSEQIETSPKETSRFEVSFARHKRHSISIYEWGLAAIFAVTLAYFAADHAMKEVANFVTQRLAMSTAGTLQTRGNYYAVGSPLPQAWEPLFSSPSFDQMLPISSVFNAGLEDPLSLPVSFEGLAAEDASFNALKMGAYVLQANISDPMWNARKEGLDPIYIRPLRVNGYLSLQNQNAVGVPQNGEPFLDPPTR